MVIRGTIFNPANRNPWYILMTLYGEQDGEEVDRLLHGMNRALWNAWACQRMSLAARAKIGRAAQLSVEELSAWSARKEEIDDLFKKAWYERNGNRNMCPALPDPDAKIDMSEIIFENALVLERAIFPTGITFDSSQFRGYAGFGFAQFNGDAGFGAVQFDGYARFDSAQFNGSARFDSARFRSYAWFGAAQFSGYARFDDIRFNGDAWFGAARFNGYARFDDTQFSGEAWFGSARFDGYARFDRARFSGGAGFSAARFSGYVRFDAARFNGDAGFSAAQFRGSSFFVKTVFGSEEEGRDAVDVTFRNTQFEKPLSFRGARFLDTSPDFEGAVVQGEEAASAKAADWPLGRESDPS